MNLRLQSRYALVLVGLTVTVGCVLSGVLLLQFRASVHQLTDTSSHAMSEQLLAQMEKRGEVMTRYLARNLANPLYLSDMAAMHELLSAAAHQKDVVYARVYDAAGKIAHDGTEELSLLGTDLGDAEAIAALRTTDRLVTRVHGGMCEVTYPIVVGDDAIGGVKIALSLDSIHADIADVDSQLGSIRRTGLRRNLMTLALTTVALVVLAVLISISIGRGLAQPIRELAHYASRVGHGDYTVPLASDRRDEIGELFAAFRAMGHDLERTTVSKDYVESIISSMTDCLALLRPDGTIEKVNGALCSLLGYTEEELVDRQFAGLVPGEERAALMRRIDSLIAEGTPFSLDGLYLRKDGQSVPVAISASSMHDAATQELRAVCVAQDITARVASENALRYRITLEKLIATISTEFISLAPDQLDSGIDRTLLRLGEFAEVDRSFVFLYSEDGGTMSNTNEWRANRIEPQRDHLQELSADLFPWWSSKLRRGEVIHAPRVVELPPEADATRETLQAQNIQSLVVLPMRFGDDLIGSLGFASVRREMEWPDDIISLLRIVGEILTNAVVRRRSERDRAALEEQMRHSQKLESLGVLTGGIAHDFNNLLVSILGNAELALLDLPPDSPVASHVEEVKRGGMRASELINQMLAYSGRGRLSIKSIGINELVMEMGQLLNVSISKKASLHHELADDLPPIRGDATQIRQIVMNLITNASDAIGSLPGTITIRTTVLHVDRAYLAKTYLAEDLAIGEYVALAVADTGCGMDNETKARLFDPFFSTKFTGRGLGLAAVLGIVKGHKGAIRVESAPSTGTTFTVIFPKSEAGALRPATDTGPEISANWRGRGVVLVVDDEETVRAVATGMLTKLGFRVIEAEDGGEAVRVFGEQADAISAVLLDFTMPVMNGAEVFEELRKIQPDVKVLLASGHGEVEVVPHFPEEAGLRFVQKPYQLGELAGALRETLSG